MATRTPPPRRASSSEANWRADVRTASRLNILAGIWLVVSPFILAYDAGDGPWNPIACGLVAAVLSYVRASGEYEETWLAWIVAAVGAWLFASGFLIADSMRAEWNSWVLGGLVVLFASASATRRRR
jgi:hypothetical protein